MCVEVENPVEEGWISGIAELQRSRERQTILLVEDEIFVRDVTAEVLRAAGYRVWTARDSREALRHLAGAGEVDLLLSDMILPGESGALLARRLKVMCPALRVLFVTGYPEQMACDLSPGDELLAKPYSTDALLRRVNQMMKRGGRC